MRWVVDALQTDLLTVYMQPMGNTQDALSLVPDMVIFDVWEASADELAQFDQLRADPLTGPVPVVFLCSSEHAAHLWGQRCSNGHCITTPVSASRLRRWVQEKRVTFGLALADDSQRDRMADTPDDSAVMQAAKSYLADHLQRGPTVDDIAASLGVSVQHLSDVFSRTLGVALPQYVRQERIRVAQRLLLQSSLDVPAIAQKVGYSTAGRFSTVFREVTGTSPAAFRRDSSPQSLTTQGVVQWTSG